MKTKLPMPEPVPVIREDGDAVVEFHQEGKYVGELNFSSILGNWFQKLGWGESRPTLKILP